MTRAKFTVSKIEITADGGRVSLSPVSNGTSEENRIFYKYTPSGSIELGLVNHDTLSKFEPGKSFYVDFTEAE